MKWLRPISIGLIAGGVAVLTLWLTRAVLPPRERPLPPVIRLDALDAYAARPSSNPSDTLDQLHLLDRIVEQYDISMVTRAEAVKKLADAAQVNIMWDGSGWDTPTAEEV